LIKGNVHLILVSMQLERHSARKETLHGVEILRRNRSMIQGVKIDGFVGRNASVNEVSSNGICRKLISIWKVICTG